MKIEIKEKSSEYQPTNPKPTTRTLVYGSLDRASEWAPTGFLSFIAEGVYGSNCQHEWRDSTTWTLEEKLDIIADGLTELVKASHIRTAEIAERDRKWAEERRRREESEERIRLAKGRRKRLFKLAERHRSAEDLRGLLKAVEGRLSESTTFSREWLEWAQSIADDTCPLPTIVDALIESQDPAAPLQEDLEPKRLGW